MIDLRPYQLDSVARIIAAVDPLVVAPTGSGKTVIIGEVIRQAENKFVLVIAHRRELIHQMRDKLAEFGISAGVILAGEPMNQMAAVQVASIQTLWSRCGRGKQGLPPADVVVIDEAHHCRARTYRKIVESYPGAKIVGLTATPCRRDGRGLGGTFKTMIECPQVEDLIKLGFLVKTVVYAPAGGGPDLRGVRTRQGDYVERELAARVDRPELVGDIVTHWHRLAERRKTVVFATSVAHSIHLCEEFAKSGVKAAHIDGKTPKDERDEILARLARGEIDVICNCMVLTEGWDMPPVSCCVLARPTKSMSLYRQMAGRVIRPADGKTNAIILDHAGAIFMHGFIEDSVVWSLDPDLKAETPAHASRSILRASNLLACTQCEAIRTAGKACPECGFLPKRPGEHLAVIDGDLQRLDRDGARGAGMSNEDRHRWHRELVGLAQERDYKPGWAGYKYKEKFGTWPMQRYVEPSAPSPEVRAWVRSRQIAYAKSMQNAQAAHA